ncbi:MAG: hypothetical protein A2W22_05055 [Candidatus Levybacteria bacterium RBG_16_35_11]|nr:MAG: hypothetical protein A2W22_05055 [Candidatus Levybacteria bacterium RBG_16_35_11]
MKFQNNIEQRLTGRYNKSFAFVGNVKDKTILDVGCSFGWFEKWAIENNCKRIIGIEPSEVDVKYLKDAIPNATFISGSALCVPYENDYFEILVMWEVLEHLPKNSENISFQEIYRVLKPGGYLFLSTPNRTFWSCSLDPAWWLVGHRHYNINELKEKLEDSGFEIINIEYGGRFYELISMILLYIFKWCFKSEMPFKSWFDKKRDAEFLDGAGFTNVFLKVRKSLSLN